MLKETCKQFVDRVYTSKPDRVAESAISMRRMKSTAPCQQTVVDSSSSSEDDLSLGADHKEAPAHNL
ncbi:hypothetical protein POPTR_017G153333v4 [Populus trichocarpa]|uniref:Uncharacterized protein n=1 Tax=Populus trichocarpa TaxID=3694 RepID=A0ACC0RSH0_POPTR|nr:hypothetical protein BDE02_17G133700 [Populus trichocarpa]KAI9379867.1 hypothetical protein POPTR_017G153333v4 [Populus trichocarpa]